MRLGLQAPTAAAHSLNGGSGRSVTVAEVAALVSGILGKNVEPEICGKYRVGDIRHCFADITRATQVLGYAPTVTLEDGMIELAEWLQDQAAEDRVLEASRELAA